jgi:hypothetical protein
MLGPTAVMVPATGNAKQDFIIRKVWKRPAGPKLADGAVGRRNRCGIYDAACRCYHAVDRTARNADNFSQKQCFSRRIS